MPKNRYYLVCWLLLFCLVATNFLYAAMTDRFEGLRIPVRRNGRLRFELLAKVAITDEKGNSRLKGITIFIYDQAFGKKQKYSSSKKAENYKLNQQPPVRFKVSSNQGKYNADKNQAILEGKVTVVRYVELSATRSTPARRIPEAKLTCTNAVWDNSTQTLKSKGRVVVRRESDVLEGQDLTYYLLDRADKQSARIILERQVKMQIRPMADKIQGENVKNIEEEAKKTESNTIKVSCVGEAILLIDSDTVFFSDNVVVRRATDDMQSDKLKVILGKSGSGKSQVAQLHAQGQVVIVGSDEVLKSSYTARGENAVYDDMAGLLVLTGRKGNLPEVQYGEDIISDEEITIDRKTGILKAVGKSRKYGLARLQARLQGFLGGPTDKGAQKSVKDSEQTTVTYRKALLYDRRKGLAEFSGGVNLKHDDFSLKSDKLVVNVPEERQKSKPVASGSAHAFGVRRVTAIGNVIIHSFDGRTAKAQKAVFDTIGRAMTLSGPPDPVIIEPGKSQVRSVRITSIRTADPLVAGKEYTRVSAEGPGEAVFFEQGQKAKKKSRRSTVVGSGSFADESGTTRVRYAKRMVYDEALKKAVFNEDVMLTRGEMVLNAGQLEIVMSKGNKNGKTTQIETDMGLKIERLRGSRGVRMHVGGRHCSADRMLYSLVEKKVTLLGDINIKARVWEKRGSSLSALRIVDFQDKHRIECDGPGELDLAEVDENNMPLRSARVRFKGRLVYAAVPGKAATANFYRGVSLRWQDMKLDGDRLSAELTEADDVGSRLKEHRAVGEGGNPELLQTSINKAVMTGNVKIKSLGREASGDKAIMLRNTASITLSGKEKAELRDLRGILLQAPLFILYQRDGVVRASGPGKLYVAAKAAQRVTQVSKIGSKGKTSRPSASPPGTHPLDYTLRYQGELVYNLMERRIFFQDRVEMEQQTLYGRCDELEALLGIDQSRKSVSDIQGLALVSMECKGNVFFRRFEPPSRDETLEDVINQGPSTRRPGTTDLIECQSAFYDIAKGAITFTDTSRRGVRILEQKVSRRRRVNRTLYHNMDKAILNRRTGDVSFPWTGKRRPKIEHLAVDGPLRLEN